ncbi:valine--tRNA ligase [Candidatus Peregrinibacteria bacterium]|nr:valine--tRNA ligase [Candidatus Peregrinibacteria bacterium]
MWEESGAFTANVKSSREPFVISMPPPNATGQLHIGHAARMSVEDIFIRFARMQGKEALWVPGTDHAAIATENVVIKKLKDGGMKDPRKELGRDKLVAKIAEFVEQSQGTIRSQIRKMGSSCDWSRERYTFEPALNRIVNEVFKKMYDGGLIYRGHRIVNWDPKLQTTVSDDEVEYIEEKAPFFTFQYGPFEISTSRPETKFGDKYVVMHPDDKRYKKYKDGETFECEWINGKVRATIIKDEVVDPAFGTGVMTITPWHDTADFDIAERHGLEKEQVIGFDGKLLAPIAGEFAGMKIEDARPLIVEKLKSKGLLVKTDENYVHNKAVSQRGKGTIEPQIKLQWFVDVNKEVISTFAPVGATADKQSSRSKKAKKTTAMSLKQIMHAVVHHGDITIIPDRFGKTYFHWIDNLRDWCISRQIWWGHRVPVWYRGEEIHTGAVAPEGAGWEQDSDTLDTWFSSSLWTWSTLIDPKLTKDFSLSLEEMLKQSPDYQKFHPTSVLETAYDILFFWVARMILMTTYVTGQVPFKTVYLSGLIRTRDGKKMSKSDPETVIDPLDVIPKYGADALRLSLTLGQGAGADSRLYDEKIAGYRNFVNKLWNASRFVLMQCETIGVNPHTVTTYEVKSLADKALHTALQRVIRDVTKCLEEYRLSEAGERLYGFVWDYFCDWYLELSKGEPNPELLVHSLRTILTLLHPFCPFVTEKLWEEVKQSTDPMLIVQPWPFAEDEKFPEEHVYLQTIIGVITAIRKLRSDHDVEHGKDVSVTLVTKEWVPLLESQESHIRRMAKVESLMITTGKFKPAKDMVSAFLPGIEVHLSLAGLIDLEKERGNLTKEKGELQKYIAGIGSKLQNKNFVERAAQNVVELERGKLKEAEEKLQKIEQRLKSL